MSDHEQESNHDDEDHNDDYDQSYTPNDRDESESDHQDDPQASSKPRKRSKAKGKKTAQECRPALKPKNPAASTRKKKSAKPKDKLAVKKRPRAGTRADTVRQTVIHVDATLIILDTRGRTSVDVEEENRRT